MFRIILLCSLVASIYSLSCPCWSAKNRTEYCGPPPTDCPLGTTLGPCGCCTVCFKIKGEICGGPWKIHGECGKGLYCKKDNGDSYLQYGGFDQSVGVCVSTE